MIYNVYVPKKLVLPDDFSQATWEEIVAACQKKKVPQSWAVGDSKAQYDNYGEIFFIADILEKRHDDYSDGSGEAELTLQSHDCYGELWSMNDEDTNIGGWKDSLIRTERLPELLESFPEPLRSSVREVEKFTSAGDADSSIVKTADKLFLLSEREITGENDYSRVEGFQYEYYYQNSVVKTYGGALYGWWTRSPAAEDSTAFCFINTNGTSGYEKASAQRGVAFAFCL